MKSTIQLEDLSCPSCVAKIEKALKRTAGVNTVEVRFNSSRVVVDFNETITSLTMIKAVISNLGFSVHVS